MTTEPNGLTEAQANLLLAGMTGIPYAATLHIRHRADTTASQTKKKRSVQLVVLPSQAEIDKRVGEPCKVRTPEGACQICACKTKDKACRAVVVAGMCRLMGVIAER